MRFVSTAFQESTLRRGKSLEQFLGGGRHGSTQTIRWVELRPSGAVVELWILQAEDLSNGEYLDFYEHTIEELSLRAFVADSPREALDIAHARLNCSEDRWTNEGVGQDEYRDFILCGRPSNWPQSCTEIRI